jgi:hypothetical protein
MADALQARLGALAHEVRVASISSDSKHTVLWCLESLPTLYAKFCQTSESRYGHEITRLVRRSPHRACCCRARRARLRKSGVGSGLFKCPSRATLLGRGFNPARPLGCPASSLL